MNAHWWATVFHDTYARLGRIQAPTLVLHGEQDAMAPLANARLLAQRIPDAELCVIPGAGHVFPLERPEETYAALSGWLDRRGPIAPGTPHAGLAARTEPVSRALGLPVGAMRTGRSLIGFVADRRRSKEARADEAADRRQRDEPEPVREPALPEGRPGPLAID